MERDKGADDYPDSFVDGYSFYKEVGHYEYYEFFQRYEIQLL